MVVGQRGMVVRWNASIWKRGFKGIFSFLLKDTLDYIFSIMKSRPCHRMKKSFYNLLKVRTALQQLCNTGIIVLKVFHQETLLRNLALECHKETENTENKLIWITWWWGWRRNKLPYIKHTSYVLCIQDW